MLSLRFRRGSFELECLIEKLKAAIEGQYGGRDSFVGAVPVDERYEGKPVCQGIVSVFDLEGHPSTTRAYAWSSPIEGSSKHRFFAVLHLGGIRSPQDAVRAAIAAEHRAWRNC